MDKESKILVLMEQQAKDMKTLNEGMGILLDKVPKIEEKVNKIEEKIERIEDNIEVIKISLRRKVDVEDFQLLEKRVMFLEKKFKV